MWVPQVLSWICANQKKTAGKCPHRSDGHALGGLDQGDDLLAGDLAAGLVHRDDLFGLSALAAYTGAWSRLQDRRALLSRGLHTDRLSRGQLRS